MPPALMTFLNDPFAWFAEQGFLGFIALYLVVYAVTLAVFIGTAAFCLILNHRRPERRIQARSAQSNSRHDFISSVQQLSMSSLLLTVGMYGQTAGWGIAPTGLSIWSFVGFFALSLVLYDAWFFWTHRLQHTRWFYRFHKSHHMATAPTVWSNDAGSWTDTFMSHTYFALILLVTPMPVAALIAARIFDQITGVIGHSGFEHFAGPTARRPFPLLCTVYHDQHHKYFRYNYGNYFSVWDRICGTVHPTYDETVVAYEAQYEREKG